MATAMRCALRLPELEERLSALREHAMLCELRLPGLAARAERLSIARQPS